MKIKRKRFEKVCTSLIWRKKDNWCRTEVNSDLSNNLKSHEFNLGKKQTNKDYYDKTRLYIHT